MRSSQLLNALWISLLFGLTLSACGRKDSAEGTKEKKSPPSAKEASADSETGRPGLVGATSLELSEISSRCILGHGGLVLDLGAEAAFSRDLFRFVADTPPRFSTRLGESFRRFEQMQTSFVFWQTEELSDFEISARVHGLDSDRIAFYIDDQRIGAAKLKRGETHVLRVKGRDRVISPGRHRLILSISRPRGSAPAAEVSWVRIGQPQARAEDFPATRREVFSEVSIGEQRHKSVILRPGGSLRCPLRLGQGVSLNTEVGLWGAGLGELEIIVHSPSQGRVVVEKLRREKSDKRDFLPLSVSLAEFAGELVDLELRAPHRAPGARVALARPKISSVPESYSSSPGARRAIVILLSGLGEAHSPPQAGEHGLPFLNGLAREGTFFPGYRVSTTSAPGALASLLTGLPPYLHQLEGTHKRLASEVQTIASLIESRGGRTALFTGVPTGFSQLGFDRGFGTFRSVLPQADIAANEVIHLAQDWLSTRLDHPGPLFTLIQLRGAHPPFDVSKNAAQELPPAEYGGELSPRRAALQLGDIRARRRAGHRRMPSEDWVRLEALKKAALLKQSAALSEFIAWLRSREAYDDALLVVMGDVGAGERPLIPYNEDGDLREDYLAVPLVIKFPRGFARGKHLSGRFAPRDVTKTILSALGFSDPAGEFKGIDLGASNATRRAKARPHLAFRDRHYSLVFEGMRLWGSDARAPKLCEPTLDPQCKDNRAEQQIMTSRALWLLLWSELSPALAKPPRGDEVEEDLDFENALTVWGERR